MSPADVRPAESGAASVAVAGVAASLMTVALAVIALVSVVADQHRARAAADLAALAAAAPLLTGAAPDCGAAATVAESMGADVSACGAGPDASVIVETTVQLRVMPALTGGHRDARARARAGVVPASG